MYELGTNRETLEERYVFADTGLEHPLAPNPKITDAMPTILALAQDIESAHARFRSGILTGEIPDAQHLSISADVVIPAAIQPIFSQIPKEIRQSLNKYRHYMVSLDFIVGKREVALTLVLRHSKKISRAELLEHFIRRVYIACHVMGKNATNTECMSKLVIFILESPFKKTFPDSRTDIIGVEHANTAFTYGCDPLIRKAETPVCVFREEEWFKVLLHELCHATGIDFSELHNNRIVSDIVRTNVVAHFNIRDIHIRLYEAYCEVWATIINVVACIHLKMPNNGSRNNIDPNVLSKAILAEARWSVFQMAKVLRFFNMDYAELIAPKEKQVAVPMDEHDVALFSYNIVKTILLANAGEFLEWCANHGAVNSAIQFTNDYATVKSLCFFIKGKHTDPQFVEYAQLMSQTLEMMAKSPETKALLNTMCMSLYDTDIFV
jgi:hypothetical protein